MTTWRIEGSRAKARCRGHDIEARWGTGRDYKKTVAERPSQSSGNKQPGNDTHGIIIHVKSPHQKVDNITMLPMAGQDPE